jgi:lipoyl(octanoyl) transferase
MLDLNRRGRDVRAFVAALEGWLIDALAELGVRGGTRPGRIGIWVEQGGRDTGSDAKIAALGIRLRRWVSLHGIALNVDPELEHFSGIVPCGIADAGVTSLARLGVNARKEDVDKALRVAFERRFGPTRDAALPELQVLVPVR